MTRKFLILFNLETNPGYHEIIAVIDYDQAVLHKYEEVYTQDYYVIKELEMDNRMSPDQFYQRGDMYEWYTEDGRRYTDYELYLKGLKAADSGLKYDEDGNLVLKTDVEKMLDGEMEIPEGKEIYEGKIRRIPYFNLKKTYNENIEQFKQEMKSNIQRKYDVSRMDITVEYDGVVYEANDNAVEVLIKNVTLGIDTTWRAADNSMHELTADQQKELASAMQQMLQQKQVEYFNNVDKATAEIDKLEGFDEIVKKVEHILASPLEDESSLIEEDHQQPHKPIVVKTLAENAPHLETSEITELQETRAEETERKRKGKGPKVIEAGTNS